MNNKGFTLVELMAVIALLAIITVIAVPSVMGFRKNANVKLYCTKVNSIKSAAVMYAQDHDNELTSIINGYPSKTILVKDLLNGYLAKDNTDGTPCIEDPAKYVCDPRDKSAMDDVSFVIYKKNNRFYANYPYAEENGKSICD